MVRKADRLFQLVNLIRTHQPVTAADLAKRLQVSVRTVYRYIDDLSISGVPIYGEAGRGYTLTAGFELPPLTLTPAELEALTISLTLLSRAATVDVRRAAQSLYAKIEAVIPSVLVQSNTPTILAIADQSTHQQLRYWDVLRQAIRQRQMLRITYRSLAGKTSSRDILALGLFYWGGVWTVGAWCFLRGTYRDFRIDHIVQLQLLHVHQTDDEQMQLPAYLRHHQDSC